MKARIKITQRMLNKSIIDANKSVVAFVRDCYPTLGYDFIDNGCKNTLVAYYDDGHAYTPTSIRLYRRPRGDKLLSVQGMTVRAKASDVMTFEFDKKINIIIVRLELGEPPQEIILIE